MKKLFIACSMALSIISVSVAAGIFTSASGEPVFTIENVDANPGTQVEVPVYLEENPGMAGYILSVNYDHNNLKLADVKAAELNVEHFFDENEYLIFGETFDKSVNEEEYYLCDLVFDIDENAPLGYYTLEVNGVGADFKNEDTKINVKNGSINVTDEDLEAIINGLYTPSPTVIIGKTSGNPGALAAVPIIVKNNSGFDKLELEMSYDTSVFTYKEVYSNIVASVNAEYTDKVKLSISSSNGHI